jgi:hypothetical protein
MPALLRDDSCQEAFRARSSPFAAPCMNVVVGLSTGHSLRRREGPERADGFEMRHSMDIEGEREQEVEKDRDIDRGPDHSH